MLPKFSSDSKGQALVEFALILVVLLLFIFIIIESGRLFQGYLTVQNAARAAGRYAMTGQFDTACLFETPPCLDPRLTSIKREARRSAGGLAIDDLAVAGETNSFVTEVWSYDDEGNWRQDEVGGPGDPIDIIARFQMPVVTPLLKPLADSVRLTGRVKVVAENYDQVGLTESAAAPPAPGTPGGGEPPEADVAIVKTASEDVVLAGTAVDYTITITNAGPFDAEAGITVVDTLPPGSFYTGYLAGARPVTCTEDPANTITCTMPWLDKDPTDLNNRATVTLQTLAPSTSGLITNTATVYPGPSTVDPNLLNNTTTANVTVRDLWADLSVTIVDDPDPVRETAFLTYTLEVNNQNYEDATGVVLTATLPAETTYQSNSAGCDYAGGVVTCDIANLNVGAVYSVDILVIANDDDDFLLPRTITINASVSGNEFDPDLANNEAEETTSVADIWADLAITKLGPDEPVEVESPFTYILQVTNLGPDAVFTSTITDTLPAGMVFTDVYTPGLNSSGVTCSGAGGALVVCDMGGLSSFDQDIGEPINKEVTIQVEAAEPMDDFNRATVSGNLFDPNMVNNFDQVETLVGQADLIINKYGPLAIDANQPMTYTVVVTNAGPLEATGVQIVDDLPPNLTNVSVLPAMTCQDTGGSQYTCGPYNLDPGQVFTVTITGIAPDQDLIVNRASASYDFPDLDEENNTAVFTTTTTLIADLEVVKLADNDYNPGGGEALAGEQLRYFIQLGSLGPSPASGLIVTDTLPPSVEFASATPQPECDNYDPVAHQVVCDMGSLVLGPTVNIRINVTPTVAGLITNTVVVTGAQPDPNPNNNIASAVVNVLPADLQLQKFATASVLVGDTITYTLVISNAGPSHALNVVITDTLPVSVTTPITIQSPLASCDGAASPVICTISELAVNEMATITMTVLATGDGLAINEAAATAQDAIEVDLATASTLINPVTDLAIDKTASGSFYAGEPLTYTLTITNYGPSIARSVRVTDTLPADATYQSATTPGGACSESGGLVTCVIDVISPAGTQTVTIRTVAGLEGDYVNTADVGSDAFDPDPTNNSVSITTPISPAADLGIEKNHSGQFFAGEIFTYSLDVTNGGPSTAQTVIVTDTLPTDVAFVSASPSAPTCAYFGATHQVVCQLGDLANGLTTGATIQVTTNITGAHVNQAETASATTDLYQANNTTALTTTIQPVADLRLAKGNVTVDTVAGQQHTYAITVTNDGPNVASNVTVTDTLPAGMTYAFATAPCTPSGQTLVCDLGGLGVGASATFEITVDVDASLADGAILTNEATVASAETDRDPADNTDTVDTLVIRRADMTVAKFDTGSPAIAGATYAYTIVVTNLGPSDASSVEVVDTLPTSTSYVSSSNGCLNGGATVTCTIGNIASGDSYTFTLTVALDSSLAAGPSILNSATVSAAEADPDGSNNTADVSTPVARSADLRLDKSDDGSPAVVGEEYTYTLVVTNDGPSDASSVSIDDTLPANTSFVTGTVPYCSGSGTDVICDIGDLPFNSSVTVTITMLVEATAVHGSIVENTAVVSGAEPDPDFAPPSLGNNSDSEFTSIVGKADVGITKSDADVTAVAGGQFVYQITVDNAGPSEATGVVVTDTLPGPMTYLGSTDTCGLSGGLVVCSPGNVASGASTSFFITVTVAISASDGTTVTNTADVGAQQVDRNQANNSASDDSLIERQTDLEIEKDDGNLNAVAGQPFEYTLAVTNNGPSDASGVVVTDTLPADTALVSSSGSICTDTGGGDLTCPVGLLPATQTAVFTVSVYVESYVTEPTSLVNVAGVYGDQFDPVSGNNLATTSTPVVRSADVAVTKSDMGVNAIVGELYTYTLDISNNGPSDASAVILTDTIPVSSTFVSATSGCTDGSGSVTCTVGNLANGASDTFTLTIRVDGDVPHGSFIVNTAGVDASESDPDQINNASSVTTEVVGKADLSIDKSDDGSDVRAGDTYTYTVSVTNLGPSQANNVVITDTLPAHSSFVRATGATCSDSSISVCEFAVLNSGTTNVFSITVRFATSAPHNTIVTNTVQVSAEEADLATANNRDEEQTLVVRESDIFVAKADNDLPAVAGDNYVYTITVGTLGPSDATGVVLTDTLPLYTSVTSVPAKCSDFGSYVRCDLDALLAGDSPNELLFTLLVNQAAPAVAITNTVAITTSEADPDLGNNQAEEATVIERVADLAVQKSDLGNTPVAGQPFSYTIAVTNNGPSIASSIEITDTLPPSVTLTGPTPPCTQTGVDVACPLAAALVAGQSTTLTMTVLIGGDIDHGTTIDNIAGVRSAETDPDLSDNISTVSSLVLGNADLAITKVGQDPPPVAGLAYTYTITVTNNGPSDATGVTVVDTLPVSTTFAGSTDSCSGAGRNYTCDVGSLASTDSQSFEISVTVDSAVAVDTPLTNVASVSGDQADLVSGNDSATAAPLVERQVNLLIDKSDDGSPAIAGQQYSFTVVVTNTGPSNAAGLQVTDELPVGTTYANATASCSEDTPGIFSCDLGNLAAGDEASFDITVDVPSGFPDGDVITNTVSVASAEVVSGPQDQEQATVQRIADLAVAKSDDGGPAIVGDNHTYTITVSNNGPSDASDIVITDTLPVSTTFVSSLPAGCLEIDASTIRCAMPNLIDGASANVQLTVGISATVANGATIENDVEVKGAEFDDNTGNNRANLSTNVIREVDLSLTKTGEGSNAVAGEAYTYTIQVTNNDALVSAAGIVVTDTLPLSTTFGSASGASCTPDDRTVVCTLPELAASTSASFSITVVVSPSVSQGAVLTNTAEVTGDVVDPDTGNNADEVATGVDRSADLQITKTGAAGDAVAGQSHDYTIVVRNDGPSDASGVVFTDTIPVSTTLQTPLPGGCSPSTAGMVCSIGVLSAGDEQTYDITIDVNSAVVSGTILSNSVIVSGDEDDPAPGDESDTVDTPVVSQADLSLSKSASAGTVYAGETVTYTLDVANNGPSIATGVTVIDTYPSGIDVSSAVTSGGTCTISSTINCLLDDLDDGDSATITIVGTPVVTGTLTNSAVVSSDAIDTTPGNDGDSVDITSLPAADVRVFIEEGVISIPTATTPFTVTVQVNNYGPTMAQGAVFTETFAVGNNAFEFISASHVGCNRNSPQAQIICDLGDLSPGASFTVDLFVRFVNSSVGPLVDHNVIISSTTYDPNSTNNDSGGLIDIG